MSFSQHSLFVFCKCVSFKVFVQDLLTTLNRKRIYANPNHKAQVCFRIDEMTSFFDQVYRYRLYSKTITNFEQGRQNCKNHTDHLDGRTVNSRAQEVESSNPKGRPNLTQRCRRFATASTSTQVAVLPWRYDAEMGSWAPKTNYTLRRNTASIMKSLFFGKIVKTNNHRQIFDNQLSCVFKQGCLL